MKNVPEKYIQRVETALNKAGENKQELKKALKEISVEQKEGLAFLIAYMPERDLKELKADFLLENVDWAYKVRNEFVWCKNLPDSIFLNEVLPYASLNERRDNWRKDFYEKFMPIVSQAKNMREAIDLVNKNIKSIVDVEYNTKREKPDQSPYESMRQHMASCSGLSILLTDAFRSVGIPSRIAGTPLWTNMRGNHNWCEVWIDGQWYFTEYYPDKLDHSWFLSDAGKADPEKPVHWIYASSFKETDTHFPLVWDENIKYVYAENVTDRYIRIYQEQLTQNGLNDDELIVNVMLLKANVCTQDGNQRVASKVEVVNGEKSVSFGYTPGPTDDMNKFLKFKLKKNTDYVFKFDVAGKEVTHKYNTGDKSGELLKLYQES
ncbi:transglutaminase domain-containing protein [Puteibacter caeruleilacunae]|nr:transglutaminase domain-containing protein [Puteibacter caeruleilacunae]